MEQTSPFRKNDAESVRMWGVFFMKPADLQHHRLRSCLVGHKPDAMIGYSILRFRLSDKDLRAALSP